MANLNEAYAVISKDNVIYHDEIEHFFNQRSVWKEIEHIDKNMNRCNEKTKVIESFLSVRIPSINNNTLPHKFDIDIFGNIGYHYTGTIITTRGMIPDFSINIKEDSKIFIHIKDNSTNNETNEPNYYTSFIDVPKRYRINTKNQENDKKKSINELSDDLNEE